MRASKPSPRVPRITRVSTPVPYFVGEGIGKHRYRLGYGVKHPRHPRHPRARFLRGEGGSRRTICASFVRAKSWRFTSLQNVAKR